MKKKYFIFCTIYRSLIKSKQISEIDHVSSLYRQSDDLLPLKHKKFFVEFMHVKFMPLE